LGPLTPELPLLFACVFLSILELSLLA